MAKTTYHGSCYCQAVRYTAEIDFETTPTGRCNCTSCRKRRWWSVQIAPEDFRLEAGEDHLLKIDTNGGSVLHLCPSCGVLVFGTTPKQDWNDGARVSISVPTLDDLEVETLLAAPAIYYDGLHDNWWNPPEEVRHL
jgi:hypothetical protein